MKDVEGNGRNEQEKDSAAAQLLGDGSGGGGGAGGVGGVALSQVDRRAVISERMSELKGSEKRRRNTRLGFGSKVDNDLRRGVEVLEEVLATEIRRRKRSRNEKDDNDGDGKKDVTAMVSATEDEEGMDGKTSESQLSVFHEGDYEEKEPISAEGRSLVFGLVGDTAFLGPGENLLSTSLACHHSELG